jgi:hypothetical protein
MSKYTHRIVLTGIAVFLLALLNPVAKSWAQMQLYTYQGPAYSFTDCGGVYPPCLANGSIVGKVILQNPPVNGVGGTVLSWYLNGSGVGSLRTGDNLALAYFNFTNGKISDWNLQATTAVSYDIYITVRSATGDFDEAVNQNSITGPEGFVIHPPSGHWSSGIQLGSPCIHYPGAASCGEPIDLGSGNMFYEATDYTTYGQNPLTFIRYYNSLAMPLGNAISLGANWRHNYDRSLTIINPSAIYGVAVERPDGQVISFSSNAGIYTTDSDVNYSLTKSGSTWTLIDGDDTVETYTASGEKGTLNSIRLRNGYTQAISYSSGQISYVSDSYSRQIGFIYSSAGLLTSITTPDSQTVSYSYVNFSSTNQNLLSTVSYP